METDTQKEATKTDPSTGSPDEPKSLSPPGKPDEAAKPDKAAKPDSAKSEKAAKPDSAKSEKGEKPDSANHGGKPIEAKLVARKSGSPKPAQPIIRIEELTKIYDLGEVKVPALNGVSIDILEGSYVAIMGPSGSGKSTMLNILGCLDRPTAGRYFLGDEDVSLMRDAALSDVRGRRIGFIFQSYNLIPQLDVVENIHVPLFYQGKQLSAYRQHCEELAELVGLGDRMDHRPLQLSGGQQQRVAVARSLVNDPLMVLADEPTGNLDTKTGLEILDLLDKLHAEGKTIIVVTHGQEVAKRAQRVIHLKDGLVDRDVTNPGK